MLTRTYSLRELLQLAGMRKLEAARLAECDPSMISYACNGGGMSYRMTCRVADAILSRAPSLALEVYVWMLSLGYAPACLRAASVERKVDALRCVGVRRKR